MTDTGEEKEFVVIKKIDCKSRSRFKRFLYAELEREGRVVFHDGIKLVEIKIIGTGLTRLKIAQRETPVGGYKIKEKKFTISRDELFCYRFIDETQTEIGMTILQKTVVTGQAGVERAMQREVGLNEATGKVLVFLNTEIMRAECKIPDCDLFSYEGTGVYSCYGRHLRRSWKFGDCWADFGYTYIVIREQTERNNWLEQYLNAGLTL